MPKKGLHTVIRLRKWEVDEKQRALAVFLRQEEAVLAQQAGLEAEVRAEMVAAAALPADQRMTLAAYLKRCDDYRTRLAEVLADIRGKIANAQNELGDAYRRLKTFEVTQDQRDVAEAAEEARLEQIDLNELGLELYRRKTSEDESEVAMSQVATEQGKAKERIEDLHILLVDDDALFLDMIEGLLRAFGVGMITRASSGRDAFAKLHHVERVVDCVLCDYSMEEGNGLQLLQTIRMAKIKFFRPDACFVLLTASGDHEIVATAARLDVSGYLVKPVTPDKLRESITKARSRAIRIDFQRYGAVVVPS